jgi:hypothetical protein
MKDQTVKSFIAEAARKTPVFRDVDVVVGWGRARRYWFRHRRSKNGRQNCAS